MDSGNSGSISTSGDEEYDSRPVHHHTLLPSTFLNQPTPQFGSISHPQISSFISSSSHHQTHHHNPSLFDLSSTYLHSLSQSQPNSNPNNFPNLDTNISHGPRSEPDCTDVGVSSPSSSQLNQSFLAPHQGLDNNARTVVSSSQTTNAARNSKKRTRASRRAPTTVLTTDTSNFRAMVQEFTGIPAPPFSGSSYSRRLDLLTASSSLRSSSSHLDTTSAFYYPLRPSPQKLHQHQHQNQLFLSSSSPPSPSTLLHNNNNMVDAIASSSATANNSSSNYHQLPPDLGLPYNHHPQNFMLSMQNQNQNHPILTFHPPQQQLHHLFGAGGFSAKSQQQTGLFEDLGVNQGQVNAHLLNQGHVSTSEGMTLRCEGGDGDGGGRDGNGGSVGENRRDVCKLNFSGSASTTLNHDKTSLENRGEGGGGGGGGGGVDSWICSSD